MDSETPEIIDVEDYHPSKEQQFSHQQLVARVMNKCLELGCKEMRAGYFNEKTDRNGDTMKVYIEDTRKAFVEAVETAEMVMVCDFDDSIKNNIKEIREKLEVLYKKLCEEEKKEWTGLKMSVKQQRWAKGITYRQECLNIHLPFYQEYIEAEVKAYREIYKELTLLTERKGFYEEEWIEN